MNCDLHSFGKFPHMTIDLLPKLQFRTVTITHERCCAWAGTTIYGFTVVFRSFAYPFSSNRSFSVCSRKILYRCYLVPWQRYKTFQWNDFAVLSTLNEFNLTEVLSLSFFSMKLLFLSNLHYTDLQHLQTANIFLEYFSSTKRKPLHAFVRFILWSKPITIGIMVLFHELHRIERIIDT